MSQPEAPPEYSQSEPKTAPEGPPPAYSPAPYPAAPYPSQPEFQPHNPPPGVSYTNYGYEQPTWQPGTQPAPNTVVTVPPAPYAVVPTMHHPSIAVIEDYMARNIFFMLCCCLPFGIVAVLKSSECQEAKRSGNVVRASQASADARKWGFLALGFGLVILCIVGGIVIFEITYFNAFSYY